MKSHILFLFAAVTLTSCQKVVELDLKNAETQVVIEGNVSNLSGTTTVRVGKSTGFYQTGLGEVITNATVTISEGSNAPVSLTHAGNGLYQTSRIVGTPGRTYTLTVTANGRTYMATSTMPPVVPMSRVAVENFPGIGPVTYVYLLDPAGVKNYYRWLLFVNGQRQKTLFVSDDQFFSGTEEARADLGFFEDSNTGSEKLKRGDKVEVEMQQLDAEVYNYFVGLDQTLTGNAATPANPPSNLSGSALGYFSAYSASRKSTVVP